MVSGTRALLSRLCLKLSEQGSGPEGVDDLCFYTGCDLGLEALRLGFGTGGWDFGLEFEIWAWSLRFVPGGWDLGLEAGMWGLRLGCEPRDWNLGLETGI